MSVERFKIYLEQHKIIIEIIEASESTHTAQEAASFFNCDVSSIVKSLLVKVGDDFELYLVPGDRKLDLKTISLGKDVRMANADEVKKITGYSIGGVPPFGHTTVLKTHVINGFPENGSVVAAAGASNALFCMKYCDFKSILSTITPNSI